MSNTYFKILNKSITEQYSEMLIKGLQRDLTAAATVEDNIYDVTNRVTRRHGDIDTKVLLKYFVINQLLNENKNEFIGLEEESEFTETPNPKIKFNKTEQKYYFVRKNKLICAKNIECVNEDGSYVKTEKKPNAQFSIKLTYDINNELIKIQVLNSINKVVSNKEQAVKMLKMKKEYVKRFKYSGFSGNSVDIKAAIFNKFCSPTETGYYMDDNYQLYKWDNYKKCFSRNAEKDKLSPLLTDYDFTNSEKVIRKEYTGIK